MLCILRLVIHYLPKSVQSESEVATTSLLVAAKDTIVLHTFDPNTADSMTLVHLGFRTYQVRRILRYRANGGSYRTAEFFRDFLDMSDSVYTALRPYIDIDTMPFYRLKQERMLHDSLRRDSLRLLYQARRDSINRMFEARRDSMAQAAGYHIKRDTIIEINHADTTDLQFIRGIGSYVARKIIRYRNQLGGYYTLEQLREIAELDFVQWDSVVPHLCLDTTDIRKIPVQTASLKLLTEHPYLTFSQAQQIYNMRRRKFRFEPADLEEILSTKEKERLLPYMDFTAPARP